MRVAIFSDTYKPQVNGVVNTIEMLDKEYRKAGIKTLIISSTGTGHNFRTLTVPFYKEFESAIFPYPKSIRLLKKFKPDIIHSHTQFNMGLAALAAKMILNVPIVTTFHTLIPDYFEHYFFRSRIAKNLLWNYFKNYFKYCDAVTAPSDMMVKDIKKRFNGNVIVIKNGVDTERFNPRNRSGVYSKYGIRRGDKVVLHVGRMSKERNLEELITAFKKISGKMPDVKLVMVGKGPIQEKLTSMAAGDKNIIFTGFVPDEMLPKLFASAYIFISPSKTDVYPLILLEACASGIPLIGTKYGGVGHIINGNIGMKYGSAAELEKQLIGILDDKKRRDRLAANARRFVETESWEAKANEFIELYRKVIGRRSGRQLRSS
jgi:glycosyltransferase involved in cell wall biosynthesis